MSTGNFYSSVVHKHLYANPDAAIALYRDRVIRTLRGFGLTLEDLRGKRVWVPGGPFESVVFSEACADVLYTDVDDAAMELVYKLFCDDDTDKGPCCDSPHFATGPYDVVYAVGLLNHVSDPKTFLRDMYSTLAPGGQILISCYRAANRGRQMVRWVRENIPDTFLSSSSLDPGLHRDIIDDLCTPIWRAFENGWFAETLAGTDARVELLDPDNDWHENMRVRVRRAA